MILPVSNQNTTSMEGEVEPYKQPTYGENGGIGTPIYPHFRVWRYADRQTRGQSIEQHAELYLPSLPFWAIVVGR